MDWNLRGCTRRADIFAGESYSRKERTSRSIEEVENEGKGTTEREAQRTGRGRGADKETRAKEEKAIDSF